MAALPNMFSLPDLFNLKIHFLVRSYGVFHSLKTEPSQAPTVSTGKAQGPVGRAGIQHLGSCGLGQEVRNLLKIHLMLCCFLPSKPHCCCAHDGDAGSGISFSRAVQKQLWKILTWSFPSFSQAMGSSCSVGFQQVFSPEIPSAVFQRELILIRRESEFANYVCGILCCFSEALAPSLFSAGAKGEQDGGMCSQMLPFMCFSKGRITQLS